MIQRRTYRHLNNIFVAALLYVYAPLSHAAVRCEQLFAKAQELSSEQNSAEVRDLKSFGEAMTQGMILNPEQGDLFEVYRKIYFGDPNTSVGNETLKSVTDILAKNPGLEKPHFREYEISTVEKNYDTPEILSKYLKSQIQTAGQVRSNLLQIEANLDFWRKIFDYPSLKMPSELTNPPNKESAESEKSIYRAKKSEFQKLVTVDAAYFAKYLNRMISRKNRTLLSDLKNDNEDYQYKAKALFTTLKHIQEWMDKKGRNSSNIRQAMVDLIHTVGFGNQATQVLLKSKNGLDKVEGLKKLLDERDAVVMDLNYEGHFVQLQQSLKIEFPTGLSKNENPNQTIQKLEKEVLAGKYTSKPSKNIRVRSLSIQEAPFRSCLGGSDCSTRTYFSKALDPNYNYFTMTDDNANSIGHVTVVLGNAMNSKTGKLEKVAFVDKLQNVSNQQIPLFLQAVAMSLADRGYKLGVPEDVGDHNGLSNMDSTRHYVGSELLPKFTQLYSAFTPHAHQYNFENEYSRAYDNLNVKIFNLNSTDADIQIAPGRIYKKFTAPTELDKSRLIQDLLNLKDSKDPNDILKYVSSGQVVEQLEKLGLFSLKEFEKDLSKIVERRDLALNVRKQAVFEILLINSEMVKSELHFDFKNFDNAEKVQISSEIKQWAKSSDKRRKKFYDMISDKWSDAVSKSDIKTLELLQALNIIDINTRNESGISTLLNAIYTDRNAVVEWLIQNPKLDLKFKNKFGFTDFQLAQLLEKNEIVDLILKIRPEAKAERVDVAERLSVPVMSELRHGHLYYPKGTLTYLHGNLVYPNGAPIKGFVKIRGGSYKMGPTKISVDVKSFEMASTHTTQEVWGSVINLAWKNFQDKHKLKSFYASHLLQFPIDEVSYHDVDSWIKALNDLSKLDDPQVQNELTTLFPEHKKGSVYLLPTAAQWEYVARLGGLATGNYSHGDSEVILAEYSNFGRNAYSGGSTSPVGLKKPITIFGKPIYDINGNVSEWTSDVDTEALYGATHFTRGGDFGSQAKDLYLHLSHSVRPDSRYRGIGFRLIRLAP